MHFGRSKPLGFVVLFVISLFTSFTASGNSCQAVFMPPQSILPLEAQAAQLIARAKASLINPELSLTDRGFIASKPEQSAALEALTAKGRLLWWGVRFYVVESVEAAKAHSAKEPDVFMQGNYIIVPEIKNQPVEAITTVDGPEIYKSLLAKGEVIYIESTFEKDPATGLALIDPATNQAKGLVQTVRKVRRDILEQAITVENMKWYLDDAIHGPFLVQSGWTLPQNRGVILRSNIFDAPNANGHIKLSDTYRKMLSLARKLYREGYIFTFNRDFKQSLDMVRDQTRKQGDRWVANSRYLDIGVYNTALENYRAGRAYSAEVWGPADATGKRVLFGGMLGFRDGPLFSPDSTFYLHDNAEAEKIAIGYAKMAALMLTQRLAEAGIDLMDAAMVTPFTKSLRGKVIKTKDFFDLADQLNPDAKVDMTSEWIPPEAYTPSR